MSGRDTKEEDLGAIGSGRIERRQVEKARMDKVLGDAIGKPGIMRRGILLAMVVAMVETWGRGGQIKARS